ncbi:MAG: hypothetical protein QM820_40890 [Minicystis sp.]
MSNRVFFYIGAKLLGAETTGPDWYYGPSQDWYEGFEAATGFFVNTLQPSQEQWLYLLEYTPGTKLVELGNKAFRLFAPWKGGTKEAFWAPPGQVSWTPPRYLGMPFRVTTPRSWEFVSSSIGMNATPEPQPKQFDIPRTGRANFQTTKTGENVPAFAGRADCSGRVQKAEFDEFIAAVRATLTLPVMSVSDCNTFHTTGYLWGKMALDESWANDPNGAVLVVDLDQHPDAGSDTSGIVSSDGWGHPLIKCYPKAAYVVLGLKCNSVNDIAMYSAVRRANTNVSAVMCKKAVNPLMKQLQIATNATPTLLRGPLGAIAAELENIWTALEALLQDQFKHIYITVDRDCMYGNRTQWKDLDVTFETPEEVVRVIDAIMLTMKKRQARLSGFDVTGLPELDASNAVPAKLLNKTDRRKSTEVVSQLQTEIRDYSARFDAWIAPVYQIKASSAYEDDSLALEYSLKSTTLNLELNGLVLDGDGKGYLPIGKPADWQIRFKSHSTSWSPVTLNTNVMLTGGRYSFSVRAVA